MNIVGLRNVALFASLLAIPLLLAAGFISDRAQPTATEAVSPAR
jgi:hypothetical protein